MSILDDFDDLEQKTRRTPVTHVPRSAKGRAGQRQRAINNSVKQAEASRTIGRRFRRSLAHRSHLPVSLAPV